MFSLVLTTKVHHYGGTHNPHSSSLPLRFRWVSSSSIFTAMIMLLSILLLKHMSSLLAHIQTNVLATFRQICQFTKYASYSQNSILRIRSPSFNLCLCSRLSFFAILPNKGSFTGNQISPNMGTLSNSLNSLCCLSIAV